jgi:hypothetical protein
MKSPPTYNSALHNPVTESAACLYIILTQAAVFDTEAPASADLKGVEVADTDGDGLMEIVDAWGQPLRFYRWPTRLFRPALNSALTTPQVGITNWNTTTPAPAPTPASLLVRSMPRLPLFSWAASTPYTAGTIIQPATAVQNNVLNVMIYQCAGAGTSGGTEPGVGGSTPWGPTGPPAGVNFNDGNVTWTPVLDPLGIDSDDPNGLANATVVNESTFHTWSTYHVTLIVSCGTDGLLGLYEPYDTTNFGTLAQPQYVNNAFDLNDMYDNITNHQK